MKGKEYKTKAKVIQRMTKDGLSQTNMATGESENISQQEADIKFGGHDRDYTFTTHTKKEAEGRFKLKYKTFEKEGGTGKSRLRFSKKELEETAETSNASSIVTEEMTLKRLHFTPQEIQSENEEDAVKRAAADTMPEMDAIDADNFDFNHIRGGMLPKVTPWRQSKLFRSGAWAIKKVGQSGKQWAHKKVGEIEEDNLGVKAAHTAEKSTERIARPYLRTYLKHHKKVLNTKSRYRRKLEQKTNKAIIGEQRAELRLKRFQSRNGEKGDGLNFARELQRKRLQRKYAAAARKSKKVSEKAVKESEKGAKKAADIIVGAIKKVIAIFSAIFSWGLALLGIAGAAVIFIVIIAVVVFSIFSMFTVATSYLADDHDIHEASVLVTQLEAELEKEIEDTPKDPKWSHIDEFRYDLDPIGHNPFVLMAWMTAKFDDFKYEDQIEFLNELHNVRYDLQYEEEVEVRTRTDENGNEQEYNYYILNVILHSKTIEEVIEPEMQLDTTNDLRDRFDALMESKGNRQIISNPFNFDWTAGYSSLYGYRLDPLGSGELQFHRGLDIPMPTGTPIKSGLTGTVMEAGYNDTFGNFIVLVDQKGEVQVKYAHCDHLNLTVGAEVKAEETIIGTVGNTGNSTGSHVHIEIKNNDEYQNPIYSIGWEENHEKK